MQFLNPAGAWAFLAVPAIVALYLLRRRHEEKPVSSTYLWRRALRDRTADRPFERLRKNALMLLQLLCACLLAFALMQPVVGGGAAEELALIFDLSASMQARSEKDTRLAEAVKDAQRRVEALSPGGRVTILAAGQTARPVLTRSDDRAQALRALAGLRAENGGARLDEAISLAQALRRELAGLEIYVYTDAPVELGEGAALRPVGRAADNRAILSLTAAQRDGETQVVAQIANYGAAQRIEAELYMGGALLDVRGADFAAGQTQAVSFAAPAGAQELRLVLTGTDALPLDDERFWASAKKDLQTVVLAGENVFLEKALALRDDLRLVRSSIAEAAQAPGAALYVYDGGLPDVLPEGGALLLVNPGADALGIAVGEPAAAEQPLRAARGELAQRVLGPADFSDVALKAFCPLAGGEALIQSGGQTLCALVEDGARRGAVLGFDLHDSNLAVKTAFPILMRGLLEYLLPEALSGAVDAVCGETIALETGSSAASARVTTPSGRQVLLAPPFPAAPLDDTGEAGLYTLEIETEHGDTRTARFALHAPAAESDLRALPDAAGETGGGRAAAAAGGAALIDFLLIALLLLIALEWGVSRRGD